MRRLAPLALLLIAPALATAQTVSAEGTEVVRLKPDTAKVLIVVVSGGANRPAAEEKAAAFAGDVAEDVRRLKLKGVTVEVGAAPVKLTDGEVFWPVSVSAADPDAKALYDLVGKVQKEVGGSRVVANTTVSYSRSDTADDGTAAALGKATKKATARAEAIAAGLGMKLGQVGSADESPPAPDAVIDGEIVRTVKVRVVYAVK